MPAQSDTGRCLPRRHPPQCAELRLSPRADRPETAAGRLVGCRQAEEPSIPRARRPGLRFLTGSDATFQGCRGACRPTRTGSWSVDLRECVPSRRPTCCSPYRSCGEQHCKEVARWDDYCLPSRSRHLAGVVCLRLDLVYQYKKTKVFPFGELLSLWVPPVSLACPGSPLRTADDGS